jgi:hypothetical protein
MRLLRLLMMLAVPAALFFLAPAASAHYCPDNDPDSPECRNTPVSQEWRDYDYVPVFDAPDRHDDTRVQYQRWRDEYGCRTEWCTWADFSISFVPSDGDPSGIPTPNEFHIGAAGDHSLTEGAHQTEDHTVDGCDGQSGNCEGIHDAHGGTAYADVCFTENQGGGRSVHDPDSCDDGMKDTEIGVVIVDKNPCGGITFGIPVPCMDEYHILRPLDDDYSARQRDFDQQQVQGIMNDPDAYLCGNENAETTGACE